MRVLDLGGTVASWHLCPVQPAHVTLLNLLEQPEAPRKTAIIGNACEPPPTITDEHFDLIYSNSVIEHVGDDAQRAAFARVVHELGSHHWVQTPNYYFPIEPHLLCPGLQFLPLSLAVPYARQWPLGNYGRGMTRARASEVLASIHLLRTSELQGYFPSSAIERERVGPFAKSLIAWS